MADNELLLALSDMIDVKLDAKSDPLKVDMQELKNEIQGLKNDITYIKVAVESGVKPNIRLLSESYVPAAKKYEKAVPRI